MLAVTPGNSLIFTSNVPVVLIVATSIFFLSISKPVTFLIASASQADAARPYTVSVGIATTPPLFKISEALKMLS